MEQLTFPKLNYTKICFYSFLPWGMLTLHGVIKNSKNPRESWYFRQFSCYFTHCVYHYAKLNNGLFL